MFKHSAEAVLAGVLLTVSLAFFAFSILVALVSSKTFIGAPKSERLSSRGSWESADLKPSLDDFRFDRAIAAYEALIDGSLKAFDLKAREESA